MNAPRTADAIVDALVARGINTFFGVPGGPVSPIFDAILGCPQARLIESRHETNAAFVAAGFYRASGSVPCVVVTAGPGVTNVVTGLASAFLERVPLLVICGDVAWAASGARLLQDSGPEGLDVEHLLAGVTRAQIRVSHARSAAAQALAALEAATASQDPGPALLVVPIHLAAAHGSPPRLARASASVPAGVDVELVERVHATLTRAKRPLLVLGGGARPHAAVLGGLVDRLGIPFVTTPRAKGLVSERHPCSLRHGGLAASRWARRYTDLGVDAALVLGSDLDDCSIGSTRYIAAGGELVHVDLDARVFQRNLPTSLGVVADLGVFAASLASVAERRGGAVAAVRAALVQIRRESPFELPDFARDSSPVITPYRALADLEAAAPEARFVTDIGEHMLFSLHYLTADAPDRFTIHLGLGSMGSGICGAIGSALGDPSRRVICICGDGGMAMAGMEALVAVRERAPVVFVVFNDARYNMVYHGHRQVFGREAAWETPLVDFAGWARALGLPTARIERPGELGARLLDELTESGPALLDVRIDRSACMSGAGRNEALLAMSMQAPDAPGAAA